MDPKKWGRLAFRGFTAHNMREVVPEIDIGIVAIVGLESDHTFGVLGLLEHEPRVHLETLEGGSGGGPRWRTTRLLAHLANDTAEALVEFF